MVLKPERLRAKDLFATAACGKRFEWRSTGEQKARAPTMHGRYMVGLETQHGTAGSIREPRRAGAAFGRELSRRCRRGKRRVSCKGAGQFRGGAAVRGGRLAMSQSHRMVPVTGFRCLDPEFVRRAAQRCACSVRQNDAEALVSCVFASARRRNGAYHMSLWCLGSMPIPLSANRGFAKTVLLTACFQADDGVVLRRGTLKALDDQILPYSWL